MEATQKIVMPKQAYRYFPKRQEEKTKFEKGGHRFYYFGQIEHDQYEKRKLKEFYEYLGKEKLQIPNQEYFTPQRLLLALAGNGYKPEKTHKAILNQYHWRKENIPPKVTQKTEEILRSGYFYVCGRDYRMRPIIVNNAKLIDFKHLDEYVRACIVVQQWVIANMLLPGQIENWIVIYDLGKMGITEVPISACKQIMQTLASNYGGKLYKLFAVNVPSSACFTWKLASVVLDDAILEKISLDQDINIPNLFKLCDKSQVEVKFGGTQPNRTSYWPPTLPPPAILPELYITQQEYIKRVQQNRLKNNIIDPSLFKK